MDTIVNFLYATLGASATNVATSLTLTTGHGARFGSTFPYDVVVYDGGTYANAALAYHAGAAEIVRVTARSTDTLTVTRAQQSTAGIALGSGWIVIQAPTSDLISQAIPNSLLTTRGDIITRGASAPQRLALGADGTFIGSDGTDTKAIGLVTAGDAVGHTSTTNWTLWFCSYIAAFTSRAMTSGRLYAAQFLCQRPCTVSGLGINVTTLAAGNARIGIYETVSATDTYPGSLIVDGGEVDTGSTGLKSVSPAQVLKGNKLYWLSVLFSATPTVSGVSAYINNIGVNESGVAIFNSVFVAQSYGALPSTFPSSASQSTNATFPAILTKFSSVT